MRADKSSDRKDGVLKKTFRVEKEYLEFMQQNMEKADVKSVNAFVNRAFAFYIGYLNAQHSEYYLPKSIYSMIHATLDLSEIRIKEALFKLAVEVAMQNRILGRIARVTEKEILEIRRISEEEVRSIIK